MTQDITNKAFHDPVLLSEVIDCLGITNGQYLDATGGLGGHSQAILENLSSESKLWICDYHKPSAENLKKKFAKDKRVHVVHERFSSIFDNLVPPFQGILADFGISSGQLDDADLGIAFQVEGPLDMRIDQSLTDTASDLLKTKTKDELADIFYHLGGERASRKIAAAIVMDRENNKFYETTTALKELCERVLGRFYRHKKIHPATKIFQALRIAVNQELKEVEIFLKKAPQFLAPGGRLVVISFHEGEDRQVKTVFKELEMHDEFTRPIRKAIKPSKEEIQSNPRSRSARMRVLEKQKT